MQTFMNISQHLGKNLIKPSEFADRKDVTTTAVWNAIHAGRIWVTVIGEKQDVYISWAKNKNVQFDSSKKNR